MDGSDIFWVFSSFFSPGGRFTKHFVSDFHRQMLKATEILASDWLRANLSVKITDKMLCETPPGVLHITLKQFLLQDSNLEQSNLVQEVHTLWWLWARLMKMLDSEAFYSLSGTIPAAFLISSGHSCCILSTFEVHFKYLRCILFEFLKVRTELGDLSGNILNSIVVPSNQTSGSNDHFKFPPECGTNFESSSFRLILLDSC